MRRKIFLHIGAHKCASTTVQQIIRGNQDIIENLLDLKIILNSDEKSRAFTKVFLDIASRRISPKNSELFYEELNKAKKSFQNNIPKNKDILMSNEIFLGNSAIDKHGSLYPFTPYFFQVISHVYEDYDIKVILLIRKQASFIESCYLQQIKEGRAVDFKKFIERIDLDRLSWLRIANELAEKFGKENITVYPFEEIKKGTKDFFYKFLTFTTDKDISSLDIQISEQSNPSISEFGVKVALETYPFFQDKPELLDEYRRYIFRRLSSTRFGKAKIMSDDLRNDIDRRYINDNKKLFVDYIPNLPEDYYN